MKTNRFSRFKKENGHPSTSQSHHNENRKRSPYQVQNNNVASNSRNRIHKQPHPYIKKEEVTRPVDSYIKLPFGISGTSTSIDPNQVEERKRLFEEVFDCNQFYFSQIMDKFYPNKKRKKATFKNVDEQVLSITFPKICMALHLDIRIKHNDRVVLTKVFSKVEKEERKKFKRAKQLLREERKKTYGPNYARILEKNGVRGYVWDLDVIKAETELLRMQRAALNPQSTDDNAMIKMEPVDDTVIKLEQIKLEYE